MTAPPITLAAIALVAVLTVGVGAYGVRMARTTSDFLVASRSVGPRTNAAAISGEYLSAASFLGVAGLVAKYGADALWYPVGFTAGYLALLLFVAAPLRRSGAYTIPDFAEFRLGSTRLRRLATLVVVLIGWLYLVPQLQGAGLTLRILTGAPSWVGALAVGVVVVANVAGGGMRSITFVQAFQYWLKLTAIGVPAIVLLLHHGADSRPVGAPVPPTVSAETRVDVTTDVVLDVARPVVVQLDGVPTRFDVGQHEVRAGTVLTLAAGSDVPVVDGVPTTDAAWLLPSGGLGGDHPLYETYSLILATFLGTMGLPHVLVRFYTNADGRAARRTTLVVLALLGVFYLFPTVLGVLSRLYVPQLLVTGTTDAAVLLLPGALLSGIGGQLLAALVAAGAVAAFLSTSSGLVVSVAGVLSTDVLRGRVRDFRVAALLAGTVPVALTLALVRLDLSQTVGLAFAVAASTFCPLLVLGIWWRELTAAGAAAGLVVGGALAVAAVVASVVDGGAQGWLGSVVSQPAALSVPAAFLVMIGVSLATRGSAPPDVGRRLLRMHAPERLGMGVDRDVERWGE
ncbi:cation acetate symporter [Rhodococcus antarcticus]|uniref:Cation acetate symporter n=1 Tax=Rhodococcus antarcticus TaxID=2987751 RepID=A0ABY6NYW9_9NOCA|nr:cation acetate symporter [Rhodococcus antarcticus]UZJ24594.1 cation acetate symporter [Rhodococcus antarcticus]